MNTFQKPIITNQSLNFDKINEKSINYKRMITEKC